MFCRKKIRMEIRMKIKQIITQVYYLILVNRFKAKKTYNYIKN